jgi:hypothetical protein
MQVQSDDLPTQQPRELTLTAPTGEFIIDAYYEISGSDSTHRTSGGAVQMSYTRDESDRAVSATFSTDFTFGEATCYVVTADV